MKKKNMLYVVYVPFMMLILVVLLLVNTFVKDEEVIDEKNNDIHKSKLLYLGGSVLLDYDDLKKSNEGAVKIVNNSAGIDDVINKIIDADKNVKMYNENDNKILEASLTEDVAKKILGNYLKIKDDVKVKILFKPNTEDTLADEIDFKINKEEILRKKMVETAAAEVENTGEKYWQWYGYNRRVEWCCVFVSWVAGQHGLIEEGKIPKFIWVKKGVDFFKEKKQWKYRKEYTPRGGDIIFYDWNNNEVIDHVGIVEKVENGYVYAIEGNVGYTHAKRKKYKLTSPYIYGYGIPDYGN